VDANGLDGAAAALRVLLALGSVAVFAPPAKPKDIQPAPHLLPPTLVALGFTGRLVDGVAVITPPLCEVPAGPFLMGTDPVREPEWADNELRQRTANLPAFGIARFPVTVAEYGCAVTAGAFGEPADWRNQSSRPDHPVVQISWKRAQDYAAWLAQTTGEPWRPPTEPEWEKAARGTDGRIYPWGNQWDSRRANTEDGGPGTTTPVGSYQGGVSPYGVYDMAGTVNEWCGIPANSPQAQPGADVGKGYLAGGSWNDSPAQARAAHRSQLFIGERTEDTGMRLVWQIS
jgi:formylglycine-generating enzyme required for sulfatase activity